MAGGRVQQEAARAAVSRLDSWTGHTMLQLARTSTTAAQQDGAVDTVVQQRSRAPRGNCETRAPSLKVAKPLSAGLAHGLAGQSEGAAVGLHKACRADDTTTPPPHEGLTRALAKLPSRASSGRTRRDLPLTGCSTAPLPNWPPSPASPPPLPGGERQGPGDVQSPHARVSGASEWCAVVQELSIRGKGGDGVPAVVAQQPRRHHQWARRLRLVFDGTPHVRAALDNGHRTDRRVPFFRCACT